MPEIKLFYKNCDCCGSGSSGSGSNSCQCAFFTSLCSTSPVHTNCKTNFVVNIVLDFSGCVGTEIGSCGSGSASGSDDGPGSVPKGPAQGSQQTGSSGSSGSECRKTCKSCCDLAPLIYELSLECFDSIIAVPDFNGECIPPGGGFECLENRTNCSYFEINSTLNGTFQTLYDDGFIGLNFENATVDSCNPLQISGTFNSAKTILSSCLASCLIGSDGFSLSANCINGSFTITEALP